MSIKQEIEEMVEYIEAAKEAGDMVEAAYWNKQLAVLREREGISSRILELIRDLPALRDKYKDSLPMSHYLNGMYRGLCMALDAVTGGE